MLFSNMRNGFASVCNLAFKSSGLSENKHNLFRLYWKKSVKASWEYIAVISQEYADAVWSPRRQKTKLSIYQKFKRGQQNVN